MRAILFMPLLGAIFTLSACKEQAPVPKIDGIECDAKCQARRSTSGTGDFPAFNTKVVPRRPPGSPASTSTKPESKE